MGLIADEHPAIYRTIEAAGLTHGKGMQSYLCMMAVRLLEMRRVLKNTGSIFLHCDPTASHYLKQLMICVWRANFRNANCMEAASSHSDASPVREGVQDGCCSTLRWTSGHTQYLPLESNVCSGLSVYGRKGTLQGGPI